MYWYWSILAFMVGQATNVGLHR